MKKLLIASQNAHKIREIKAIFGQTDVQIISLKDINDFDDVEENGTSFFENALIKAKHFAKKHHMMTLADDSGLVVYALDGHPGIYSARYSGHGDHENNLKVLREMEGIEDRRAYFISSVVIAYPNGEFRAYEGKFDGYIGIEERGQYGFGYDSIFYLPEYQMTSAQIEPELKNRISHRAKALSLLKEDLDEIINHE